MGASQADGSHSLPQVSLKVGAPLIVATGKVKGGQFGEERVVPRPRVFCELERGGRWPGTVTVGDIGQPSLHPASLESPVLEPKDTFAFTVFSIHCLTWVCVAISTDGFSAAKAPEYPLGCPHVCVWLCWKREICKCERRMAAPLGAGGSL